MKIVGFVPAKGSSTRLSSKNKRKILGVPIFLWAANNLSRVLPKQDIYVDSDDEDILNLARKNGFNVIKRPAFLATNDTDGNKLLEWEAHNVDADIYIQHLPPMIFCRKSTILNGIDSVKAGYDTAVYLHDEKNYIWKNGKPTYNLEKIPNSFDLEPQTSECMGLYVVNAKAFKNTKMRINHNFKVLKIDNFEKNDIDYEHDFIQAEALANYFYKNKITQYYDGIESIDGNI